MCISNMDLENVAYKRVTYKNFNHCQKPLTCWIIHSYCLKISFSSDTNLKICVIHSFTSSQGPDYKPSITNLCETVSDKRKLHIAWKVFLVYLLHTLYQFMSFITSLFLRSLTAMSFSFETDSRSRDVSPCQWIRHSAKKDFQLRDPLHQILRQRSSERQSCDPWYSRTISLRGQNGSFQRLRGREIH